MSRQTSILGVSCQCWTSCSSGLEKECEGWLSKMLVIELIRRRNLSSYRVQLFKSKWIITKNCGQLDGLDINSSNTDTETKCWKRGILRSGKNTWRLWRIFYRVIKQFHLIRLQYSWMWAFSLNLASYSHLSIERLFCWRCRVFQVFLLKEPFLKYLLHPSRHKEFT